VLEIIQKRLLANTPPVLHGLEIGSQCMCFADTGRPEDEVPCVAIATHPQVMQDLFKESCRGHPRTSWHALSCSSETVLPTLSRSGCG